MYRHGLTRTSAIVSLAVCTLVWSREGALASGGPSGSGSSSGSRDCNGQLVDGYPTVNYATAAETVVKPQVTDPGGNNVTSGGASNGQAQLAEKLSKIRQSGGCIGHARKTSGGVGAASKTRSALLPLTVTSGSGYSYLSNLTQQPQITNSWCGEATVTEMALTTPGPSYTTQSAVAAYWGASSSGGTSTSQLTAGANQFVGVPDFGYNFYAFDSWLSSPNPTATQRGVFLELLQIDVGQNAPVAGDAYEVSGGHHLAGHPTNMTIFHWFEIGGWNTNSQQIYYADSVHGSSAVSWSANVTAGRTWFSLYDAATIMGGRGYVA